MEISIQDIAGGTSRREIRDPIDGPGSPVYRRIIHLDVRTGGQPDRIRVDGTATQFSAVFSSATWDVLSAESPVSADLDPDIDLENGVRVRLGRPWKIHRIAAGEPTGGGRWKHRTAAEKRKPATGSVGAQAAAEPFGEIPASDPSVGAVASKAEGVGDFPGAIALFRMDGDAVAPEPTVIADNGSVLYEEFISADFAVQWRSSDGTINALTVDDLSHLQVTGFPTGPRIGLTRPYRPDDTGPGGAASFFWQLPGEIRDPSAAAEVNAAAGERLADALQARFDAHLDAIREVAQNTDAAPVIPDTLRVGLVAESDAPCCLDLDFRIAYGLVRETLSSQPAGPFVPEKQRLRFPGGTPEKRPIYLRLPDGGTVEAVSLKAAPAFGPHPPRPIGGTAGGPGLPATSLGAALTPAHRTAFRIHPPAPLTVTALSLGLMAHQPDTQLDVTIQEDWNGTPSGKHLASAAIHIPTAGRAAFHQVDLGTRLALFAQPYWIRVSVAKGAGVWLGTAGDGGVIRRLPPTGRPGNASVLKGMDLYYRFHAPPYGGADRTGEGPIAAPDLPFQLLAGGLPISPASVEDDTVTFAGDALRDHLNGQLTGAASPSPADPVSVILHFVATLPGGVTVYPPRIIYSLP